MHTVNTGATRRRFVAVCTAWTVMLLWLLPALSASAVNHDYLSEDKWHGNELVTWETINSAAGGQTLTGQFGWYVDESRCLYTYFAVEGSLLENNRDCAAIVYHVVAGNETYDFAADGNGICDTPSDEASRMFEVGTNFDGSAYGVYIGAVQYLGKADTCRIDVSFNAGKTVRIMKNIAADLPEETTTEKPTKAASEKEKTTKPATTKGSSANSSGGKTAKSAGTTAKAENPTKFTPQGGVTDSGGIAANNAIDAADAESEAVSKRTKLSKDAVILLCLGIAVLLAGAVLTAAYCRKGNHAVRSRPRQRQAPKDEPRVAEREAAAKANPEAKEENNTSSLPMFGPTEDENET